MLKTTIIRTRETTLKLILEVKWIYFYQIFNNLIYEPPYFFFQIQKLIVPGHLRRN